MQRRGFKHDPRGKVPVAKDGRPDYLQGALFAMDPTTGYVEAMVGGRDFGESRFNRAVQAKRQSGSAFKPFVFAAALEAGHSPANVITRLNEPIETLQGKWVPEDEHSRASAMTLRQALKTSSNRAAVQLLQTVGIPSAVSYAEKLNVGTPPSVPSLALGTSEVTLMSLTAAYGAFASGGILREPTLIRHVEDSEGKVLYTAAARQERVLSESTAFMMSSMLQDVVNHGTGYRARQAGFTLPAAGKTGTTNDYVDAWFVGYTPRVITGVWIGFDQPSPIIANGYGGELAVPIWAGFMKKATADDDSDWYKRPDDVVSVTICRVSGKLPNHGCSSVQTVNADGWIDYRSTLLTEFFRKGTQPTTVCPLHAYTTYIAEDSTDALNPTGEPIARPPVAPPVPTSGSPAPFPSARPVDPPKEAAKPAEPEKKRGFWSRLFGRDDKKNEKKKKDPPKKPGGGGP